MDHVDTLIAARWIVPIEPAGVVLEHHAIAIRDGRIVAIEPYERDRDRYGRLLRIVTRDGNSLGMTLVAEGHARAWDGARRPWCV